MSLATRVLSSATSRSSSLTRRAFSVMPDDAAEQSALNRQGITENARRVKELEREVAELKTLVAKLMDER